MIPIIENEVTKKRKWITDTEILDIIVISETTPGPIAVNAATYVGYKVSGILGSIFATLGLALPSFVIIFVISYFYKDFMQWKVIQAAFKGLKVGVIILLINAVIKLKKNVKFDLISIILFILTLAIMILSTIFDFGFKYLSLCLILFGLLIGIVLTALSKRKEIKKWFSLNSFIPSSWSVCSPLVEVTQWFQWFKNKSLEKVG